MIAEKERNFPPRSLAWLIWGLAAVFYFTGFYQRLAPAVITELLMADFGIGAAALGNLSAFYFYSYVAMQLPTGVMVDYLGPRRILACGALVSALGTVLFALAPDIYLANLGRFLVGGAVAVAWVAMLKLAACWFPGERFATVTGLALLCGVSGAVAAGVPFRYLVDLFGWREVIFFSGLFTLILAWVIWLVIRDDPRELGLESYSPRAEAQPGASVSGIIKGVREIFRYRNAWLLVAAPGGIVGPLLTFSGLWGVPFLTTHHGMTPREAAAVASTLLVAWAIGGVLLGSVSDRVGKRKPVYLAGSILATGGWGLLVALPQMPPPVLVGLAVVIGLSSGCMILGFAFIKESTPPSLSGTATGLCNAGVMIGPMILQPLVGWLLDLSWTGAYVSGVRIYDLAAYRGGFSLMLIWSVVSALLISFTRETDCRQRVAG